MGNYFASMRHTHELSITAYFLDLSLVLRGNCVTGVLSKGDESYYRAERFLEGGAFPTKQQSSKETWVGGVSEGGSSPVLS